MTFCNLLGDTSLGEGRGILRGRKVYRHTARNAHTQNKSSETKKHSKRNKIIQTHSTKCLQTQQDTELTKSSKQKTHRIKTKSICTQCSRSQEQTEFC